MKVRRLPIAYFTTCVLPIVLATFWFSVLSFHTEKAIGEETIFFYASNQSSSKRAELSIKESHAACQLLRVPMPITGNVERQLIAQIRSAVERLKKADNAKGTHPILILEFDSQDTFSGTGSEFEDCLKLARFLISPNLNGIKTVAYLPKSVHGHAVLVVMACDQVMMATEGSIGDISNERGPPDPTILSSYRQIAKSRKTFPIKVAESLVDPRTKLLRVKTDQGTSLVFASELNELERTRTIDPLQTETIFPGGEPANLTARQARDLGVVSHLVDTRAELASDLGLSRNDLQPNQLLAFHTQPQIILVDRYVGPRFAETRISMLDKAIREDDANFVCLWIDSPQGDPAEVMQLAAYVAQLDPKVVHTVAYIPTAAPGSLPLLALACDDIVMRPTAILGGDTKSFSAEDTADIVTTVKDLIVPRKMRNEALSLALFDPNQTVYVFRNPRSGAFRYLTEREWEQLDHPEEWRREAKITREGKSLRLTGRQAEDFGMTRSLVQNFSELKTLYGLEGDPTFAEPNWVDSVVGMLSSPGLAWLLILIGFAGIYAELQMPGIGVGGFLATVAFTIYFWANFMNHTANELEIVLFLIGVSCLILEIFIIPGFGIFGLGGGILILIALILASQTFVYPKTDGDLWQFRNSLMTVGGALGGLAIFALISRRFLPHTPLLSRLILPTQNPQAEQEDEQHTPDLLGMTGKTVTDLRPSGKAIFDNELVDVIAEGEWITTGTSIAVVEIHGSRIVVKPVSS